MNVLTRLWKNVWEPISQDPLAALVSIGGMYFGLPPMWAGALAGATSAVEHGGDYSDILKAAMTGGARAYLGGQAASYVGGAAQTAGLGDLGSTIAAGAAGGAAAGAAGALLTGGNIGKSALYGLVLGGATSGALKLMTPQEAASSIPRDVLEAANNSSDPLGYLSKAMDWTPSWGTTQAIFQATEAIQGEQAAQELQARVEEHLSNKIDYQTNDALSNPNIGDMVSDVTQNSQNPALDLAHKLGYFDQQIESDPSILSAMQDVLANDSVQQYVKPYVAQVDPITQLTNTGLVDQNSASVLHNAGYSANDVQNLIKQGYTANQLTELASTGIPSSTLSSLAQTQFTETQIDNMLMNGHSATEIASLSNNVNSGALSADQSVKLLDHGFNPSQISALAHQGGTAVSDTILGIDTGLTPKSIQSLRNSGYNMNQLSEAIADKYVDPNQLNNAINSGQSVSNMLRTAMAAESLPTHNYTGVLNQDLQFLAADAAQLRGQGLNQAQIQDVLYKGGAGYDASLNAASIAYNYGNNPTLIAQQLAKQFQTQGLTQAYQDSVLPKPTTVAQPVQPTPTTTTQTPSQPIMPSTNNMVTVTLPDGTFGHFDPSTGNTYDSKNMLVSNAQSSITPSMPTEVAGPYRVDVSGQLATDQMTPQLRAQYLKGPIPEGTVLANSDTPGAYVDNASNAWVVKSTQPVEITQPLPEVDITREPVKPGPVIGVTPEENITPTVPEEPSNDIIANGIAGRTGIKTTQIPLVTQYLNNGYTQEQITNAIRSNPNQWSNILDRTQPNVTPQTPTTPTIPTSPTEVAPVNTTPTTVPEQPITGPTGPVQPIGGPSTGPSTTPTGNTTTDTTVGGPTTGPSGPVTPQPPLTPLPNVDVQPHPPVTNVEVIPPTQPIPNIDVTQPEEPVTPVDTTPITPVFPVTKPVQDTKEPSTYTLNWGTAPEVKIPTGLNPGWITNVPTYYQTTNPAQSQYYWGGHPYQPGPTFNPSLYNQIPNAPTTPWGATHAQTAATAQDIMNQMYGQYPFTVTGPVMPTK